MTNEEFIKLARESGFVHGNPHSEIIIRHSSGAWVSIEERLHQFALLVAASEREACAKLCDDEAEQFMQCAGSMTTGAYDWKADGATDCAEAIRARSQK